MVRTRFSIFIFFTLVLIHLTGYSQVQWNHWRFGHNAALDFTSGSPVSISGSALNQWEGSATISDNSGNLAFYTDGQTIWNKVNNPMPNGTGLTGNASTSQSSIIVPQPGSTTIYYVFTLPASGSGNMCYSVVDMSLNAGLGDVTAIKNVPLLANTSEKITAVKAANNIDWWVVGHPMNSNTFSCWKITSAGLNIVPVQSSVGTSFTSEIGCMKASPLGNKIALALRYQHLFELFDFDNCSGVVSNPITLNVAHYPYGVEFSADGSKLYGTQNLAGDQVLQWDITAGSAAAIIASMYVVSNASNSYWIQRGNDGKIYICMYTLTYIDVINNPNNAGAACGYVNQQLNLVAGTSCNLGLSNFPVYINLPPPSPFTYVNNCAGSVTQFYVPDSASLVSVQWNFGDPGSGANNLSTDFSPLHSFTAPGIYNVTLIKLTTCGSDTQIQQVNTVGTPVAVNLGNDTTLCPGQTLSFDVSFYGTSFLWQDGATTSSYTVSSGGTYWVHISDISGCNTADTIVVNYINVTPPVVNSNSPVCEGATINLTTAAVAGATYNWTGPNAFTSNLQNPTVTNATSSNAGTYSLTISLNGCSSSAGTVNVVVNPIPAAPILGSNSPVCEGGDINLTSNLAAGATINWSGPNAFASTLQNPSVTAATILNAGNYSATVTVNGCVSPAGNTNVIVNQAPAPPVVGSNSPVCEGGTISLTATSVAGAIYSWSGPNSFSSNLQNPAILNSLVNASGNYSATASLNGCVSQPATVNVVVVPSAALTFSLVPDTICNTQSAIVTLTSAVPIGAIYNLNANPGTLTSGAGSGPWTIQYNSVGTFPIILSGTVGPCLIAPDTQDIVVMPKPIADFTTFVTYMCDSAIVDFTNNSTEIGAVLWNFGDGITSTGLSPSHTYMPGTYDVTLTITSPLGCSTTYLVPGAIQVEFPPMAAFTGTPSYADSIELNDATVLFLNQSQNATTYFWDFGDGGSATFLSGYHQFTDTGDYMVTLIAMNSQGCADTAVWGPWVIAPNMIYFIPSAFTPNGDGMNDLFKVFGSGIKHAELKVFDRWGEFIFETLDMNSGWDGTYKGVNLNSGVYVYSATLILNNGKRVVLKGDVSLLR